MQAFSLGAQFARESAMLKLPEERNDLYSPQSSTVIKSKMAATTILFYSIILMEGEIKDAKMSSFSSDFQTLIKHSFPLYFLYEL